MAVPNNLLDDDFDSRIRSLLEEYHIPGLSIAVVDNGTVSAKGFGIARFPDVAATPDTLYFGGSTTKAMLAAAAGALIHGAKDESNASLVTLQHNSWTTTIQSLLPDKFKLTDEYATKSITIEDALSHRTGLSGADYMYGNWMSKDPGGIVSALRHLGPLSKPFRTAWQYNNLMYSTVANALKAVTNLDCGPLLKQLLWDPLQMAATFWRLDEIPKDKQEADLARGYYWVAADKTGQGQKGGFFVPEPYLEFAGIAPAGAVISSATDYSKWITELLLAASAAGSADTTDEQHVLSPKLFEELTATRSNLPGPPMSDRNHQLSHRSYALGWVVLPPLAGVDHPIISHAGGLTGFGAQLYLLPNDNFGIVTFANTAFSSNIVGDIICLELISRKVGMNAQESAKFMQSLKSKLPPEATLDEIGQAEAPPATSDQDTSTKEEAISPQDADIEHLLQSLIGEYEHPAFGRLRLSWYKDECAQHPIMYMPWVPCPDRASRDWRRKQSQCIQVEPVGERTWKYKLLLHPRTESKSGAIESVLFFDLETLNGHGNVEDDACPGLPTGCEAIGEQKAGAQTLRNDKIFHSQFWSQRGGAVKIKAVATSSEKSTTHELGLRLLTELIQSDGDDGPGWDEKMIWLKPIHND